MTLKILDVWLNEVSGDRVKPDGVATNLTATPFPAIFRGDTLDLRIRAFTYAVEQYAAAADSDLRLALKETRESDTEILAVEDAYFGSTYWTNNPYTVLTLDTTDEFTINSLITGDSSGATGRVLYHDTVQRRVYLRNVTGTFEAEDIEETLTDGEEGETGTSTAFAVEEFDRTIGQLSCKFDLTDTDLATYISNQQSINAWAEISEKLSTGEIKTIGQFELTIYNDMYED